jgi:putative flavoprotein involved in K+ transport
MLEAIVIGGGQAGLAMSHHLSRAGLEHVILERGRVGETWRSQRWDSFALNTPGRHSALPGDSEGAGPADGFAHRDDFVSYLDDYAHRAAVPVQTGVSVTEVRARATGDGFVVRTDGSEAREARAVVVATGLQRVPRLPPFAADLPRDVQQLHSSAYRNAAALPSGAVLVVGSAQSGVQVVEDLLEAGRMVYLATSRVGRLRRRYRGRDIVSWLFDIGFFSQAVATLPNPAMQFAPQPMISGVGPFGHTVSLQSLADRGVTLLGHVDGVDGGRLVLRDDLGANVAWADERSAEVNQGLEAAIARKRIDAAPLEADAADDPHPDPAALHSPTLLDLAGAGISTVIWTTGVTGDLSFLPPEAVSPDGRPSHTEGVAAIPGLYFVGLPWLRNRASGIIPGAGADAAFLVQHIAERLSRV